MRFPLSVLAYRLVLSLLTFCLGSHIVGDIMGVISLSFLGDRISQWTSWSLAFTVFLFPFLPWTLSLRCMSHVVGVSVGCVVHGIRGTLSADLLQFSYNGLSLLYKKIFNEG